jgi:hypothetical protein
MTSRKPGLEEEAAPFETGSKDASERAVSKAPRLARPTSGPVDIRALHEEISADFPKTLARLAE